MSETKVEYAVRPLQRKKPCADVHRPQVVPPLLTDLDRLLDFQREIAQHAAELVQEVLLCRQAMGQMGKRIEELEAVVQQLRGRA